MNKAYPHSRDVSPANLASPESVRRIDELRASLKTRYNWAPENYQDAVDLVRFLNQRIAKLERELRLRPPRTGPHLKKTS